MNNPGELEPRLQKLDKVSEEILRQHRERELQGILPPLTMKYDAIQGFFIEAACNLPELTLVAEYFGQVRTDLLIQDETNDSIMELLSHEDPAKSLVIVPYTHANAARFFNGINNSVKDSKRKH